MLSLIITLLVIGVLLWLINTYIPMDAKIKQVMNIVVIICVVLWLLSVFGVLGHIDAVQVPRLR
jgi:hypothetical protein